MKNWKFMEDVVTAAGLMPERVRGVKSRHSKNGHTSKLVWHIIHPSGQRYYCDTAPWSHDEPLRMPKSVVNLCDVCVARATKENINMLVEETDKVLARGPQRGRTA